MKACKIILIILYIIAAIYNFLKSFTADGDDQLSDFLAALLNTIIFGVLYAGAGIFDLD